MGVVNPQRAISEALEELRELRAEVAALIIRIEALEGAAPEAEEKPRPKRAR